ncbi:hypothetical protein ACFYVL_28315 [Streptomyces sp. NPDC004111]|uniref:hypothetical protein n=1 Tax=Streptomyces sp. NPDC004111 TaxID=3364690 RepID=UPI00368784EB
MNDGCNGREERHGRGNPPGDGNGPVRGGPAGGSPYGPGGADNTVPGGPFGHGAGSGAGASVPGPGGPAAGPVPDGPALSPDELAVRRLMQGAVEGLTPSDGALDHLRRAVPVRRARRRQAVVGMAAAVLLIGTAVPAFLHVSNSGDSTTAHPANAGHAETSKGTDGDSPDAGTDGGSRGTGSDPEDRTPGKSPGQDPEDKQKESEAGSPDAGQGGTGGGTGGKSSGQGAYEQISGEPPKPACDGGQLKVVKAVSGTPDAKGRVYGTFRIANKSGSECAVPGEGRMNFQAMGAADQSRIKVVDHTSGDPADGLPDPAKEARALVLPPDAAYEVQFAWVPQDTCPTGGASPDPTPTSGTGDTGGQATGGGTPGGDGGGKVPEPDPGVGTDSTGTAPQLGTADGDPADGKVAVSHTAEPGAPSAETTIPNACAGTIYRTGVLDAP